MDKDGAISPSVRVYLKYENYYYYVVPHSLQDASNFARFFFITLLLPFCLLFIPLWSIRHPYSLFLFIIIFPHFIFVQTTVASRLAQSLFLILHYCTIYSSIFIEKFADVLVHIQ